MLVVRVEVHPGGEAALAREIDRIEIANVSELAEVSNYIARRVGAGEGSWRSVKGHRRADGWLPLVRRVLEALAGGEGAVPTASCT